MNGNHLLTAYDVAGRLAVTPRRVGQLIREGDLPYIELPTGEVRFLESDLAAWLDGLKHPVAAETTALPTTITS